MLEKFVVSPVFERSKLAPLAAKLIGEVKKNSTAEFVGSHEHRLVNTVYFVVPGVDSIALLAAFYLEGICASSGSACSAGSLEPSHMILALGNGSRANSLVRFSFGRDSTAEEVDFVCSVLPEIVRGALPGNKLQFSCE